jgi:DNA-directed RNA polymerase II subunit RPB1
MYGDGISCVYSDDNSNKLVFRIRLLKNKKQLDYDKINDLNYIKAVIKDMRDKLIIKGIDSIKSVTMFKNKTKLVRENEDYKSEEEWILDTDGINMLEMMNVDNVDQNRIVSNDIYEVYDMLGIEAARTVIMNEFREVIDAAGSYVNYRHISLLTDVMTNRGSLMSIDRFGINRGNIGPLAKCSFEETTDQLFKAAIFGEVDNLNGVSANIMMGQIPQCGTGATEFLLDESKLYNINPETELEVGDIETWEEKADYCDENIGIDFDIDAIEPSQF